MGRNVDTERLRSSSGTGETTDCAKSYGRPYVSAGGETVPASPGASLIDESIATVVLHMYVLYPAWKEESDITYTVTYYIF